MALRDKTNLFFISAKNRVLQHVLFWLGLFLFDGLIFGIGYNDIPRFMKMALLEVPGTLLFSYVTIYWLLPRYMSTRRSVEVALLISLLFLITGAVNHIVYLRYDFYPPEISTWDLPKIFLRAFYAVLKACIFFVVKLVKLWYENEKRVAEMERSRLSAELKMLKDQVNPHFLFNTLNNLYGLIAKNPLHAQESVLGLSRILHFMLHQSNNQTVALRDEIRCMNDYIELEKLRYSGSLSVAINIQDGVEDLSIVPLIIFPLVENSFKHGASESIEESWINIEFSTFKNDFIFKIENSKAPPVAAIHANGIGLSNVKRRLELVYEKDHSLQIIDSPESFLAVLKISSTRLKKNELTAHEASVSYSRG